MYLFLQLIFIENPQIDRFPPWNEKRNAQGKAEVKEECQWTVFALKAPEHGGARWPTRMPGLHWDSWQGAIPPPPLCPPFPWEAPSSHTASARKVRVDAAVCGRVWLISTSCRTLLNPKQNLLRISYGSKTADCPWTWPEPALEKEKGEEEDGISWQPGFPDLVLVETLLEVVEERLGPKREEYL